MDKRLSIKLSALTFFFLCIVVLSHAQNIFAGKPGLHDQVWFVESFLSNKLVKISVPMFAFISGYLFFFGWNAEQTFDTAAFKKKIGKRMRTVLLPYVFWCTFWFLFIYVLQMLPGTSKFFSSPLYKMSVFDQIKNWIIEPVNYPFWYMRELVFMILISPLVFVWVKYLKVFGLIIIYIIALFSKNIITVWDIDMFRWHMIFCFTFGTYCAVNRKNMVLHWSVAVQYLLIVLTVAAFVLLTYLEYAQPQTSHTFPVRTLAILSALFGSLAVWTVYDRIDSKKPFTYHKWYDYSFILYACHGVPLVLLNKGFGIFTGQNPILLLVFYFVSAILTILGCIAFGSILKKYIPTFYAIVTGNR
ncbi:acyltransferase family protein [Flavobacterium silvaticum]|uniref:Acyltransferase n=1 Tax=Flavobacterium silvaticum TaxID=1852020 RepID=A0A972FWW3_9FLAO|nr:acyltransferase [Flavobacterium silvaticum]NMH29512.1 acyltransferase [Flavobacterium silvaticum]